MPFLYLYEPAIVIVTRARDRVTVTREFASVIEFIGFFELFGFIHYPPTL